jgi:hypothetical protein
MKWSPSKALTVVLAVCPVFGCGEAPKKEPAPEKKMLDKLESDDPETFLEGVDEAGKKYGKQP